MALDNNEVLRLQRLMFDISGAASSFARSINTISDSQETQTKSSKKISKSFDDATYAIDEFKRSMSYTIKSSKTANAILNEQIEVMRQSTVAEADRKVKIKQITDAYKQNAKSVTDYVNHTISALERSNVAVSSSWKTLTERTTNAVDEQFKQFGSVLDAAEYKKSADAFFKAMSISGNEITIHNKRVVEEYIRAGNAIGNVSQPFKAIAKSLKDANDTGLDVKINDAVVNRTKVAADKLTARTTKIVDNALVASTALSKLSGGVDDIDKIFTIVGKHQAKNAQLLDAALKGNTVATFHSELENITKTLNVADFEKAKKAFLVELTKTADTAGNTRLDKSNAALMDALDQFIRLGKLAGNTEEWFAKIQQKRSNVDTNMSGVVQSGLTKNDVGTLLQDQAQTATKLKNDFIRISTNMLEDAVASTADATFVSTVDAVQQAAAMANKAFAEQGKAMFNQAAETFVNGSQFELENTVVALLRDSLKDTNSAAAGLNSIDQVNSLADYTQSLTNLASVLAQNGDKLDSSNLELLQAVIDSGTAAGMASSVQIATLTNMRDDLKTNGQLILQADKSQELIIVAREVTSALEDTESVLKEFNKKQGRVGESLRGMGKFGQVLTELMAERRNTGRMNTGAAIERAGGVGAIAASIGSLIKGALSSIKDAVEKINNYTSKEYDAFVGNNLQMNRTAYGTSSATDLKMGEGDYLQTMAANKQAWSVEGSKTVVEQMKKSRDDYEQTFGSDSKVIAQNQLAFKEMSQITGLTTGAISGMMHDMRQMSTVVALSTQEIADMVVNISKDNAFQSVLQKLNVAERAATMKDLQATIDHAAAMGMSKESIQKFAQAVMTVGEGLAPEEIVGDVGSLYQLANVLETQAQAAGVDIAKYGLSPENIQQVSDALATDASARTEAQKKAIADMGTNYTLAKNDIDKALTSQIKMSDDQNTKSALSLRKADLNSKSSEIIKGMSEGAQTIFNEPQKEKLAIDSERNRLQNGQTEDQLKQQGEAQQKAEEPVYLEFEKWIADATNTVHAFSDSLVGTAVEIVAGFAMVALTVAAFAAEAGAVAAGIATIGAGLVAAAPVVAGVVVGGAAAAGVGYAVHEAWKYFSGDDKGKKAKELPPEKPNTLPDNSQQAQITPEDKKATVVTEPTQPIQPPANTQAAEVRPEPPKLPTEQINQSLAEQLTSGFDNLGKDMKVYFGTLPQDVASTASTNAALLDIMQQWINSQKQQQVVPVQTTPPNVTR